MTFTAKYKGVLPRTPQGRPKSEIYTPKRQLRPFQVGVSPPRGDMHCSKTTSNVKSKNTKEHHILNDGGWAVDLNNLFFPFLNSCCFCAREQIYISI